MDKPETEYNLLDWWKKVVLENYANFSGRARRAEYWYFTLVNLLIIFGLMFIYIGLNEAVKDETLSLIYLILMVIYILGTAIPGLAVSVRRLHDTNRSGLWVLAPAVPFVGSILGIVMFVFHCLEGDRGYNDYGADPKNPNDLSYSQGSVLNLQDNAGNVLNLRNNLENERYDPAPTNPNRHEQNF